MLSMSKAAFANVGFIGLGNMGLPMARNLAQKGGHKMFVYDLSAAALQEASTGFQATACASPKEVAAQSDVVVTMLPSSPHVRETYEGAHGIFQEVKPDTLLIDASTIDPSTARSLAGRAKTEFKAPLLDAPVSGGVVGAAAGTLTVMVGGEEKDFAKAKPYLDCMGANVVHCGGEGNGQVVKVCNNLVLGITMIGVSEAMNLGVRLGMDPKVLAGIFNTSSARCWSSDTYNPVPGVIDGVPAGNDYEGGFGSALMAKDLGLAVNAAHDIKAALPLGSQALQFYNLLCDKGMDTKDFGVAYKFLSAKLK